MSAAEQFHAGDEPGESYDPTPGLSIAADAVEVRRSAGLSAVVSVLASVVAIAWFGRAIASGAVLDWVLVVVTGAIGVLWLAAFVDARTPLLVADQHGVRARLGRTWLGLPWSAVAQVQHRARRGPFRDGVLDVVPHNPDRLLSELAPRAARQARLATRMHGGPLAVPIGLGARVQGSADDLGRALEELAAGAVPVIDLGEPTDDAEHAEHAETAGSAETAASFDEALATDEVEALEVEETDAAATDVVEPTGPWSGWFTARRVLARSIHGVAERFPRRDRTVSSEAHEIAETDDEVSTAGVDIDVQEHKEVVASRTPEPARDLVVATRTDVIRVLPEQPVDLDQTDSAIVVEDEQATSKIRRIARESHPVEPLVIDDLVVEPALDPVIGPEIRASRTRIGLSADQLAERTRIRPHVIEAIEVDDFVPCGGDFYARGHLKTLARVLGLDAQPLLTAYDERYANAPIDARRVFEAELASGGHGPIRGMRGGPNWSVLVAAVMAVVLCWSVAQLVMDAPSEVRNTPVLDGSGGPGGAGVAAEPVKVDINAPDSGAEIVVRDQAGKIVFEGRLAIGESQQVEATPPVRVQSSDGSVTVAVAGKERGPVGEAGSPAQGTYAAKR